jgi:hypothetical protein
MKNQVKADLIKICFFELHDIPLSSESVPPFRRKEYARLLMAVNAAKANVKVAVRPYHRRDRPENLLKDERLLQSFAIWQSRLLYAILLKL